MWRAVVGQGHAGSARPGAAAGGQQRRQGHTQVADRGSAEDPKQIAHTGGCVYKDNIQGRGASEELVVLD